MRLCLVFCLLLSAAVVFTACGRGVCKPEMCRKNGDGGGGAGGQQPPGGGGGHGDPGGRPVDPNPPSSVLDEPPQDVLDPGPEDHEDPDDGDPDDDTPDDDTPDGDDPHNPDEVPAPDGPFREPDTEDGTLPAPASRNTTVQQCRNAPADSPAGMAVEFSNVSPPPSPAAFVERFPTAEARQQALSCLFALYAEANAEWQGRAKGYIEGLLNTGVDPNVPTVVGASGKNESLLLTAVRARFLPGVRLLLEKGAKAGTGETPEGVDNRAFAAAVEQIVAGPAEHRADALVMATHLLEKIPAGDAALTAPLIPEVPASAPLARLESIENPTPGITTLIGQLREKIGLDGTPPSP